MIWCTSVTCLLSQMIKFCKNLTIHILHFTKTNQDQNQLVVCTLDRLANLESLSWHLHNKQMVLTDVWTLKYFSHKIYCGHNAICSRHFRFSKTYKTVSTVWSLYGQCYSICRYAFLSGKRNPRVCSSIKSAVLIFAV